MVVTSAINNLKGRKKNMGNAYERAGSIEYLDMRLYHLYLKDIEKIKQM